MKSWDHWSVRSLFPNNNNNLFVPKRKKLQLIVIWIRYVGWTVLYCCHKGGGVLEQTSGKEVRPCLVYLDPVWGNNLWFSFKTSCSCNLCYWIVFTCLCIVTMLGVMRGDNILKFCQSKTFPYVKLEPFAEKITRLRQTPRKPIRLPYGAGCPR